MILTKTTDIIEVLLSGAVTTNELQCVAEWDNSPIAVIVQNKFAAETNGVTPVSLVVFEEGTNRRTVTKLSVYNADTVSATVTIRLNDNGTYFNYIKKTLQPGESLQYTEEEGFFLRNLATESTLESVLNNQTNGTQQTGVFGGNTDASTNVSIAAWTINTSTAIISANSDRRGISITNGTNKTILIRLGGTLTTANYTVSLAAGGIYEVPYQLSRLAINGMYITGGPAPSGNIVLTIANK